MAKAINTFLKSKMNKDLDARLIPNGEYRDAYNIQVSRSDGDGVGTVENILGNYPVFDFEAITGVSNLYCIGHLKDDNSNTVFLFLTDNPDPDRLKLDYYPSGVGSNHFVFACNPSSDQPVCLVKGPFLNFSQKNPIYGVNLLEKLLFWTDNRNQPRKINIDLANPTGGFAAATYYTTEDQISVAKYNPYACMELYEESYLSIVDGEYESTMYDVSSLYYPNGGAGNVLSRESDTVVRVTSFKGDIQVDGSTVYDSGATVSVLGNPVSGAGLTPVAGATVQSASYDTTTIPGTPFWEITITGGVFPTLSTDEKIVLNPNPYYDINFSGDDDFLEDKFVRFSYRFRFDDNEYSVFAPFTQIAFIPKQDGYFMYVKEATPSLNLQELDNQADAYRSTVVYFVENKIDKIKLRIPLPFLNYNLQNSLKIKEVDILYKESDSLAVKVVDTLTIDDISNSAGSFTVNGAVTNDNTIVIDNLQGGINVGDIISGTGIVGQPKVSTYTPTNVNNPSLGGTIILDTNQTLEDDANLQAGEPSYYVYNYLSKKPFKTLPEKDLTRVYDKIPVRSLSQEVTGNRVIYGNYQDKHTPPKALNYNVSVSNKSSFLLNEDEGTYNDGAGTIAPGGPINIDMGSGSALFPGRVISSNTPGVTIPPNTLVSSTNNNGEGVFITGLIAAFTSPPTYNQFTVKETNGFIPVGAVVSGNGVTPGTTILSVTVLGVNEQYVICSTTVTLVENQPIYFGSTSQTETIISLNKEVVFPAGVVDLDFKPESSVVDYTSIIEYPNSSLKQNRNYQAGVVLSDRFGRTSTVILSNNKDTIRTTVSSFSGSTIYSPYNDISQTPSDWPGDSIKLLFNEAITSFKNSNTGTPGLYNGDPTSADYNPLGWYSFKIVVKQTEQEYYNVYLPGIMASYPDDATLELGNTSHAVLINDNINKIPRDLSEVGPQQKQFRSSVQLYGRVENTNIEITPSILGKSNTQYYPGRSSDTVSTISTLNDLFEYDPSEPPRPNYFPQFYLIESNPLVARISTESKIGQTSVTNFNTITASIAESATTDTFRLVDIAGDFSTIVSGDIVLGRNFPEDLTVVQKFESTPAGTALTTDVSPAAGEKQIKVDNIPIGGAGNGTLVTGVGVPNGTAITGISGTSGAYIIEVNNTVNVLLNALLTYTTAPQLKVSSAQTVTLDQDITIIPDTVPGIQYLAVYETKPVESLLDIFWETSSSGLISDLNNAIINDSSAGAGLSEWNQTPFTEGLALNANVLSTPFFIEDNFGILISINDINEPLLLTQVVNQSGQDVTDSGYFTLVQTTGENEFQIQATTAYYNAIYFGEEDSSSPSSPQGLRNFSLRFQATVNNQPLDVTRELILANENPQIISPSDAAEFNTTNNVTNITTINCINGASNLNLRSIFQNGSCTITSQTIFGQTDPVDYFAINPQPTPGVNEAQFQLINTNPGNVPVERYRLEICVEDAGGTNDKDCIEIFIDFGVKIKNVKQYCVRRFFRRRGWESSYRPDYWYQFYTVFQAWSGGDSNVWGWYLYNGAWSSQSRQDALGVDLEDTIDNSGYGVNNFPNAFIDTAEYDVQFSAQDFFYPGIIPQVMKGTEQDPLVDTLGGDGVITIDFQEDVNQPPLNNSFRWVPITSQESDVIQLWENSSEIRAWCFSQFPDTNIYQKGNYSKFTIENQNLNPNYGPDDFNPAPDDTPFYPLGWNLGQDGSGQNNPLVLIDQRDINENDYGLDEVAWQIVP
jgi:hypothetical protein